MVAAAPATPTAVQFMSGMIYRRGDALKGVVVVVCAQRRRSLQKGQLFHNGRNGRDLSWFYMGIPCTTNCFSSNLNLGQDTRANRTRNTSSRRTKPHAKQQHTNATPDRQTDRQTSLTLTHTHTHTHLAIGHSGTLELQDEEKSFPTRIFRPELHHRDRLDPRRALSNGIKFPQKRLYYMTRFDPSASPDRWTVR